LETEALVIDKGVPASAIAALKDWVAESAGFEESFTWTTNGKVPDCVGVPPSWPVAVLSVTPAGRLPELTDQEYGVVPPLAKRVVA
jgi:hypothetical protein